MISSQFVSVSHAACVLGSAPIPSVLYATAHADQPQILVVEGEEQPLRNWYTSCQVAHGCKFLPGTFLKHVGNLTALLMIPYVMLDMLRLLAVGQRLVSTIFLKLNTDEIQTTKCSHGPAFEHFRTSSVCLPILQRFTSLSPQKHQQRFLDNVRSVLRDKNIFHYRTVTLFNQKHAVRFKTKTTFQCSLCHHSDSALHILTGYQHHIFSGMISEHHTIAFRLITKAIEVGSLGVVCSNGYWQQDRLALQNLGNPIGSTNRTIPEWLFHRRFPSKQRLTTSRPDAY